MRFNCKTMEIENLHSVVHRYSLGNHFLDKINTKVSSLDLERITKKIYEFLLVPTKKIYEE